MEIPHRDSIKKCYDTEDEVSKGALDHYQDFSLKLRPPSIDRDSGVSSQAGDNFEFPDNTGGHYQAKIGHTSFKKSI